MDVSWLPDKEKYLEKSRRFGIFIDLDLNPNLNIEAVCP